MSSTTELKELAAELTRKQAETVLKVANLPPLPPPYIPKQSQPEEAS